MHIWYMHDCFCYLNRFKMRTQGSLTLKTLLAFFIFPQYFSSSAFHLLKNKYETLQNPNMSDFERARDLCFVMLG